MDDNPALRFSVTNRLANMLVWVLDHGASAQLNVLAIPLLYLDNAHRCYGTPRRCCVIQYVRAPVSNEAAPAI